MQKMAWMLVALFLTFGCFHDRPEDVPIVEPNETAPPGINITSSQNYSVGYPVDRPPEGNGGIPLFTAGYTENPGASFAVYFIDVGTAMKQGDAIFIKKGDLDILVDAGPEESGTTILNFLKTRNVDDIELWITTHADTEHYGGIREVLEEFYVEEVWWTGQYFADMEYFDIIVDMQNQGAAIKTVKRGDIFNLNGMRFEVLNPRSSQPYNNPDNDAVVLRILDRDFCIMLTSDIQAGPQGDIANMRSDEVRCVIMQAPLHGLGAGNIRLDQAMLRVDPEVMIISGGPNEEIGGARQPLFERLILRDVDFYTNYDDGTVRVVSNGFKYNVSYWSPS